MTARQAGKLLNRLERFKQHGYLFASEGHGPCAVVAAAWRYFNCRETEEPHCTAESVAAAYTTVRGTYAYEE